MTETTVKKFFFKEDDPLTHHRVGTVRNELDHVYDIDFCNGGMTLEVNKNSLKEKIKNDIIIPCYEEFFNLHRGRIKVVRRLDNDGIIYVTYIGLFNKVNGIHKLYYNEHQEFIKGVLNGKFKEETTEAKYKRYNANLATWI